MNHEALASKAADAVGVTPHSDMRLFVEQAVKWALKEAALSAAEPVSRRSDEAGYIEFLNQDVPYIVRDIQGAAAILMDLETRNVIGYRVYDPDSVFAPQPAPSLAVKALRWKGPDSYGEYHSLDGLWGYIIRAGNGNGFWLTEIGNYFPSPEAAQAAAQADYEARIRSALSAQVQDVAGWLPADQAPRGTVGLIRHRSGQIDYVYKTDNGEPFLETWRYAGTANHGQQAPWPEYYLPISALPSAPAKQED